jgi:hypothetical protein
MKAPGETRLSADREQVLAYRLSAQGLHRTSRSPARLAVLDIGVQDAAGEQARLAFDARLGATPPADVYGPGHPLALVWSLRGAPHVHRRAELDGIAGALFPLSEADAAGRLNETGPSVERAGIAALEQFGLAVDAMHSVVTRSSAKGAVSTAVSRKLPEVMLRDCRACRARHLSDSAMRVALLAAGLELQPGTSPPVLLRRPMAGRPDGPDRPALTALLRAYLRLLGPATVGEAAGYVDARRADVEPVWPDRLVPVEVDGRVTWLPAEAVPDFENPPEPALVRILGASDPYLQARDRAVLVPDKSRHKVLWPVLGRPMVLLVDGEVSGTVRPKASGKRLTLRVEPFGSLPSARWEAVQAEAERVAAVRGFELAAVQRVD